MDWNQDPHLQMLEEKLDQVIEFQQSQKTKTNQSQNFFPLKNVKRFFNAQTEHSVITSLNPTSTNFPT